MNMILKIAKYELTMRLRSRGFILVVLLANFFAVFVASPMNITDPKSTASPWFVSGQTFWIGTMIMTLIGGIFSSDTFTRDKALITEEAIKSNLINNFRFVAGRCLGTATALVISGVPMFFLGVLIQGVSARVFEPLVFILAFFAIFVPGMIFISIASMAFGSFFGNQKICKFLLAGLWLVSSNVLFNIGEESRLHYLLYTGGPAYRLFELRAYRDIGLPPGLMQKIPSFPHLLTGLGLNLALLLIAVIMLFFVLNYFENKRQFA